MTEKEERITIGRNGSAFDNRATSGSNTFLTKTRCISCEVLRAIDREGKERGEGGALE